MQGISGKVCMQPFHSTVSEMLSTISLKYSKMPVSNNWCLTLPDLFGTIHFSKAKKSFQRDLNAEGSSLEECFECILLIIGLTA